MIPAVESAVYFWDKTNDDDDKGKVKLKPKVVHAEQFTKSIFIMRQHTDAQ